MQGNLELQRKVEERYKQMWGVREGADLHAAPDAHEQSVSHMQAFDGRLQMHLPRNVPANAFAPDVVV